MASGVKVATLEKALFDLAYLSGTRSRLFARPPELDLPKRINRAELRRWVKRIAEDRRRNQVERKLSVLLQL
jgi:hypothetical protein